MDTFGEKIKTLRTGRNLTTGEMARALGIPQSRYSELENGVRVPTAGQIERLETYFGVSSGELAAWVGSPE